MPITTSNSQRPRPGLLARVLTVTPPWWGRADVVGLVGLLIAGAGVLIKRQETDTVSFISINARRTPAGLWRAGPIPDATGEIQFEQTIAIAQGWGWTGWSTNIRLYISIFPGYEPPPGPWVVEGGVRRELSKAECLAILEERAAANDTLAVTAQRLPFSLPWAAGVLAKTRAGQLDGFDGDAMFMLPRAMVALGVLTLAAAAALAAGRLVRLARRGRALRLLDAGVCPACRYARAGLAPHAPCPECGADPAVIRAQAVPGTPAARAHPSNPAQQPASNASTKSP